MSDLMYWTGFGVWLGAALIVAACICLVVIHLVDAAIFTCRIGRARAQAKKPARSPWVWLRTWSWSVHRSSSEVTFYPNGFDQAGVTIYWPRCAPSPSGETP